MDRGAEEELSPLVKALVEDLVPFAEGLRAAGYRIETGQILAVHGLLLGLAARGRSPDCDDLARAIGPVVCGTAREQGDFPDHFARWVGRLRVAMQRDVPPPPPARDDEQLAETLDEVREDRRRAVKRHIRWMVPTALVVAMASGLLLWWHRPWETAVPVVAPGGPGPAQAGPGGGPPPSARLGTMLGWFLTVGGIGFELAASGWLAARWLGRGRRWWDREADAYLARRREEGRPPPETLRVRPPDPWPRVTRRLDRAAVDLLERRAIPTDRLDIPATLDATLRQSGRFAPVFGHRMVTPEYLVMVDRQARRDHQADWADALVDRLIADQVVAIRFTFRGDPRICYRRHGAPVPWSLADLAGHYPDHRLLLFTDGEGLLDPTLGLPAEWVEAFASWPLRALMTPLPRANWGVREAKLSAAGFVVEPATADGLAAVAARLTPRRRSASGADAPVSMNGEGNGALGPLPVALRREPARWVGADPPPSVEVEALMRDLRTYLPGDDYDWLACCAVYPELSWDLTLELGRVLAVSAGRDGVAPSGLARLVRLPWFRRGAMPDWLRLRLLAELDERRLFLVRRAISQLLLGAERVNVALLSDEDVIGATLDAAMGGVATRGAAAELLARSVRSKLASEQHPDGPFSDPLFAGFVDGQGPDALAANFPESARALLAAAELPARSSEEPFPRRPGKPTPLDAWITFGAIGLYLLAWLAMFIYVVAAIFVEIYASGANFLQQWIVTLSGPLTAVVLVLILQVEAMRLPWRAVRRKPPGRWSFVVPVLWAVGLVIIAIYELATSSIVLIDSLYLFGILVTENTLDLMVLISYGTFGALGLASLIPSVRLLWRDPRRAATRLHRLPMSWGLIAALGGSISATLYVLFRRGGDTPGALEFMGVLEIFGVWQGLFVLFCAVGPLIVLLYLSRWRRIDFRSAIIAARARVAPKGLGASPRAAEIRTRSWKPRHEELLLPSPSLPRRRLAPVIVAIIALITFGLWLAWDRIFPPEPSPNPVQAQPGSGDAPPDPGSVTGPGGAQKQQDLPQQSTQQGPPQQTQQQVPVDTNIPPFQFDGNKAGESEKGEYKNAAEKKGE